MIGNLALRITLAIALLGAQMGGLVHGVSHVAAAQSQLAGLESSHPSAHLARDTGQPDHPHCNLCDAYAQIANAVGSSVVIFTPVSLPDAVAPANPYSHFSVVAVPFSARAPPLSALRQG